MNTTISDSGIKSGNGVDLSLLQPHTVQLYHLAEHQCVVRKVKARSLLYPRRFDLFAKLYYIRLREENRDQALKVYTQHIKAFNPDEKEPGRDDKQSLDDFVAYFDHLINHFATSSFDATVSVVPVDANGIILDGGHRVAALAFYDKDVVVGQYAAVHSVADFDYQYFLKRGLSRRVCDIVALETIRWCQDVYVACLWPIMGKDKKKAIDKIRQLAVPFYDKSLSTSLRSFGKFITQVYKAQSWVGTESNHYKGAMDKAAHCYASHGEMSFVFFSTSKGLDAVLQLKDQIRSDYPYGKHSIHITDTKEETKDIACLLLTQDGQNTWQDTQGYRGWHARLSNYLDERLFVLKNVYLTRLKVKVYYWMRKFRNNR